MQAAAKQPAAGQSASAGALAPAQAILGASHNGSVRRQGMQYTLEIPKKLATTATTSSRAAVDRILGSLSRPRLHPQAA